METQKFINRYFGRTDAYDMLVNGRGLKKEELGFVASKYTEMNQTRELLNQLRAERNKISGLLRDTDFRESEDGKDAMRRSQSIGAVLSQNKSKLDELTSDYETTVLALPNPPSLRVPVGKDSNDNPVIRVSENQKNYSFEPKSHYELLAELGLIVDGIKVTGQGRFPILLGEAAALEDSLRAYFLSQQRLAGRFEVTPPHMVNRKSLTTTGQLPKFESELYHVFPGGGEDDLFMVPTAEAPITNLAAESLIDEVDLPLKLFGYSRCFRVEVGSGGRDTQGLKRVHDFGKIEMVDIVKPENSWNSLEEMVQLAERILKGLELDYRIISLCTGDLPSGSAFTYDIETRIPDTGWREVSSCTNTLDYQARRGHIRFKETLTGNTRLVHTLNGSAFPTGRLTAAIIEQYQERDGSVAIPEVLRTYTNFDHIKKSRSISTYFK